MNRREIIEGVKRKGSYGIIFNPKLRQDDRDIIERQTKCFLEGGGKIEQIDSNDEFAVHKKAAVTYGGGNE